jgi:hypothetical protein
MHLLIISAVLLASITKSNEQSPPRNTSSSVPLEQENLRIALRNQARPQPISQL